MPQRRAVVVGGGIGGLTAAAALTAAGWQVALLERAAEFAAVGAGITMMSNALRALRVLGLEDEVRAGSVQRRGGGIRSPRGRWLSRSDTERMRTEAGMEIVALHRAELHRILLGAVPGHCLTAGAEVTGIRTAPDGATVEYTVDGEARAAAADLVVAADGINSVIRSQLWAGPTTPTYSGTTAWRAVTSATFPPDTLLTQTWGRAEEVGVVPLTDGRVYWFVAAASGPDVTYPDDLAMLRRRYAHWHAPIPELMAATEPDAVAQHDIYHLSPPLPTYVDGRVVLLGDAAHAMVPNLGQGACQAIEDAVVLAALVRDDDADLTAALAEYDRRRRPRTQRVAASALRMNNFGMRRRSKGAVLLRDLVVRATPPVAAIKQMSWLGGWTPPVDRL